jgi:hypothetical protein
MISTALRRISAAAAVIIAACLIAAAAAVSAHGAVQPQRRQLAVTTLAQFKLVLTATRGGPGHRLQATVTVTGYRRSGGHWTLIAAKRVGPVNGWQWFSVDTCSLTATQFKNNTQPSPPVLPSGSAKVSLLLGPALGCSTTYSERWTP